MKTKIILLSFAAALVLSCNANKAAVADVPPPPPPPVEKPVVAAVSDAHAKGQSLYENNCAKCHKLFAPADFSQQDWRPILARMQKKARLDDADMGLITNYIFDIQKN
ncbi:MAG: cytochrome C [Flavobacterium sp. BFFFF1]|uniref:c-type cytochrome n=1 Tax=unclassified Flavobacterium TaxID=196869 RepID=UPI000BD38350|nr:MULTISPECIES: cytochrome c [unclassified Flavobacterium]OYU79405.1 MAG: cytochrome C [Flavobacterium sp. BFFFF1]